MRLKMKSTILSTVWATDSVDQKISVDRFWAILKIHQKCKEKSRKISKDIKKSQKFQRKFSKFLVLDSISIYI